MIKQLFVRFLKEKKIYYKYLYNKNTFNAHNWRCSVNVPDDYMTTYLESERQIFLISHAFKWDKTKDGYYFWAKINSEWEELIRRIMFVYNF